MKSLHSQKTKSESSIEEILVDNNVSNKPSPLSYKNLKPARRKALPRKYTLNKTLVVQNGEDSKVRCAVATADYSTTRITIVQVSIESTTETFLGLYSFITSRSITFKNKEFMLILQVLVIWDMSKHVSTCKDF